MTLTSPADLGASTFADLGVPPWLLDTLARHGITSPFPIQAMTLPDGLAGRDLCGRAPTGSGKTIAFGLPLLARVGQARPKRPRGLVLVPTRELAAQVCDELSALGRGRRSAEAVYGGVGFERQLRALRRGVDIVVACPGRLADLIERKELRLDEVEFVVIDEADRMADMGFLPEVRRILDRCPDDRQTLLFSATLDGEVDVLIRRYQTDPARHELAVSDDGGRAEHYFWSVERADRVRTAARVVDRVGPTVVFCRTKRGADRVARQLGQAGVSAAAIHGDRSQAQRERALQAFHRGEVAALVATDVAARGIHVDDVAGVIHFDPPADAKDYTHRSGRTARAGQSGVVVTFVPTELRKPVQQLQRHLDVGRSIDPVDVESLPASTAGPAPAPRPQARTQSESREGRPRRPAAPGKHRARTGTKTNSKAKRARNGGPTAGPGPRRKRR